MFQGVLVLFSVLCIEMLLHSEQYSACYWHWWIGGSQRPINGKCKHGG